MRGQAQEPDPPQRLTSDQRRGSPAPGQPEPEGERAGPEPSAWAPLRIGLFRALWIAALVSNVGTWMQTVGAQWLLVQEAHASVLVALVQTATTLPAVLFALVAGVLAGILDRAGLVITKIGGAAVFAVNTATFVIYAIVVASHPNLGGTTGSHERFLPGLRAGGRYVRHAPVVRRILLRAVLFLLPGSALWALLPLVATTRFDLGPGGYGALLGAMGVGAIAGAFVLPPVRARLSANAMVAVASLVYATALVVLVLSPDVALIIPALLLAGAAWITFLSNVNATMQLFLPQWVRARGLSVYQMVLFGGQAAGAAIFGVAADVAGLVPSLLLAALLMAAGAATIWFWPFHDVAHLDRSQVRWPEPILLLGEELSGGPVLVQLTYTIAADKKPQFLQAMTPLRLSRLRTGATDWALYRDARNPRLFIELFGVPSWEEHVRQHRERLTATDVQYRDAVAALSDPPPRTEHYLSADVPE